MQLHQLKPAPGSRRKKTIVGRGEGSTLGQTAGKGQKGQSSRSGETIMNGFEGGQTPLFRRVPKRGFNHASKIHYLAVNLEVLEKEFEAGSQVNPEALVKIGLLKTIDVPYKILGGGKITKALTVSAHKWSKSAEKALRDAGGKVVAVSK